MMHDIDKGRIEHVQFLEQQLQHAQRMVQDMNRENKWVPKVGINMAGVEVQVTLEYHGVRKTVAFPTEVARGMRAEDLTSQITQAFLQDLVFDGLRNAFKEPVSQLHHQLSQSAHITKSTLA